jgi:hypothetical protein
VPSHSEPFASHSERSEESLRFAQGKLRKESRPVLFGAVRLTQSRIPHFAWAVREQPLRSLVDLLTSSFVFIHIRGLIAEKQPSAAPLGMAQTRKSGVYNVPRGQSRSRGVCIQNQFVLSSFFRHFY